MKFIVSAISSALLSYAFGLFLPWWSIMIVGLLVGFFIPQKRVLSFLSVFLGVALLWGLFALLVSSSNEHILAKRVALLVIKKDDPYLLVLITGIIGGISSGISAVTGRSLALLFKQ